MSFNHIHTTLANGLSVVAAQSEGNVSYMGVAVNAGSRDESPETEGLAHFVEHTIFKGTRNRNSWQISNRMESVGGELNAYTTKEETMIYAGAPAGYAARGLELIADLIKNANFPTHELDLERDVIVEEIYSYKDSPSERVYDEFDELLYKGSPLGHNILGTVHSVNRLTSADARSFVDRFYTPDNMVVYCCDPADPEKSVRLIEKYFSDLDFTTAPHNRTAPALNPVFDEVMPLGNHQANVIMGSRLFARTDTRRFALFLLNNYLGGPSMNSRLNHELRDRRGLCYTIESNVSLLSDTGQLSIFFGTAPRQVSRCRRLVLKELTALAETELSPRRFEAIRNQYCGQLTMAADNTESRIMSMAKSLLYFGQVNGPDYTASRIREVTPAQIRDMAALILESGLSTLILE